MLEPIPENELTCNLSGNILPLLSQLTEPQWTDPGLKGGISVRKLISTSKKQKQKAQTGNEWSHILPQILANKYKATTTLTQLVCWSCVDGMDQGAWLTVQGLAVRCVCLCVCECVCLCVRALCMCVLGVG